MKKDILVSVIMPAYNTQDTIKRSIDRYFYKVMIIMNS